MSIQLPQAFNPNNIITSAAVNPDSQNEQQSPTSLSPMNESSSSPDVKKHNKYKNTIFDLKNNQGSGSKPNSNSLIYNLKANKTSDYDQSFSQYDKSNNSNRKLSCGATSTTCITGETPTAIKKNSISSLSSGKLEKSASSPKLDRTPTLSKQTITTTPSEASHSTKAGIINEIKRISNTNPGYQHQQHEKSRPIKHMPGTNSKNNDQLEAQSPKSNPVEEIQKPVVMGEVASSMASRTPDVMVATTGSLLATPKDLIETKEALLGTPDSSKSIKPANNEKQTASGSEFTNPKTSEQGMTSPASNSGMIASQNPIVQSDKQQGMDDNMAKSSVIPGKAEQDNLPTTITTTTKGSPAELETRNDPKANNSAPSNVPLIEMTNQKDSKAVNQPQSQLGLASSTSQDQSTNNAFMKASDSSSLPKNLSSPLPLPEVLNEKPSCIITNNSTINSKADNDTTISIEGGVGTEGSKLVKTNSFSSTKSSALNNFTIKTNQTLANNLISSNELHNLRKIAQGNTQNSATKSKMKPVESSSSSAFENETDKQTPVHLDAAIAWSSSHQGSPSHQESPTQQGPLLNKQGSVSKQESPIRQGTPVMVNDSNKADSLTLKGSKAELRGRKDSSDELKKSINKELEGENKPLKLAVQPFAANTSENVQDISEASVGEKGTNKESFKTAGERKNNQGINGNKGPQAASGSLGTQVASQNTGTQATSEIMGPQAAAGNIGTQITSSSAGAQATNENPEVEAADRNTGIQAASGNTGIQATNGNTGAQTTNGITGAQVIDGSTEAQASSGNKKAQAIDDSTGAQAANGKTGTQAANGNPGAQALKGNTAAQSALGNTGVQGSHLSIGAQAANGTIERQVEVPEKGIKAASEGLNTQIATKATDDKTLNGIKEATLGTEDLQGSLIHQVTKDKVDQAEKEQAKGGSIKQQNNNESIEIKRGIRTHTPKSNPISPKSNKTESVGTTPMKHDDQSKLGIQSKPDNASKTSMNNAQNDLKALGDSASKTNQQTKLSAQLTPVNPKGVVRQSDGFTTSQGDITNISEIKNQGQNPGQNTDSEDDYEEQHAISVYSNKSIKNELVITPSSSIHRLEDLHSEVSKNFLMAQGGNSAQGVKNHQVSMLIVANPDQQKILNDARLSKLKEVEAAELYEKRRYDIMNDMKRLSKNKIRNPSNKLPKGIIQQELIKRDDKQQQVQQQQIQQQSQQQLNSKAFNSPDKKISSTRNDLTSARGNSSQTRQQDIKQGSINTTAITIPTTTIAPITTITQSKNQPSISLNKDRIETNNPNPNPNPRENNPKVEAAKSQRKDVRAERSNSHNKQHLVSKSQVELGDNPQKHENASKKHTGKIDTKQPETGESNLTLPNDDLDDEFSVEKFAETIRQKKQKILKQIQKIDKQLEEEGSLDHQKSHDNSLPIVNDSYILTFGKQDDSARKEISQLRANNNLKLLNNQSKTKSPSSKSKLTQEPITSNLNPDNQQSSKDPRSSPLKHQYHHTLDNLSINQSLEESRITKNQPSSTSRFPDQEFNKVLYGNSREISPSTTAKKKNGRNSSRTHTANNSIQNPISSSKILSQENGNNDIVASHPTKQTKNLREFSISKSKGAIVESTPVELAKSFRSNQEKDSSIKKSMASRALETPVKSEKEVNKSEINSSSIANNRFTTPKDKRKQQHQQQGKVEKLEVNKDSNGNSIKESESKQKSRIDENASNVVPIWKQDRIYEMPLDSHYLDNKKSVSPKRDRIIGIQELKTQLKIQTSGSYSQIAASHRSNIQGNQSPDTSKKLEEVELIPKTMEKKPKSQGLMEKEKHIPNAEKKSINLGQTHEEFFAKNLEWNDRKFKWREDRDRENLFKMMENCTFQPDTGSVSPPKTFDANEFYQRNIKWSEKIKHDNQVKQEEALKKLKKPISRSRSPPESTYFPESELKSPSAIELKAHPTHQRACQRKAEKDNNKQQHQQQLQHKVDYTPSHHNGYESKPNVFTSNQGYKHEINQALNLFANLSSLIQVNQSNQMGLLDKKNLGLKEKSESLMSLNNKKEFLPEDLFKSDLNNSQPRKQTNLKGSTNINNPQPKITINNPKSQLDIQSPKKAQIHIKTPNFETPILGYKHPENFIKDNLQNVRIVNGQYVFTDKKPGNGVGVSGSGHGSANSASGGGILGSGTKTEELFELSMDISEHRNKSPEKLDIQSLLYMSEKVTKKFQEHFGYQS